MSTTGPDDRTPATAPPPAYAPPPPAYAPAPSAYAPPPYPPTAQQPYPQPYSQPYGVVPARPSNGTVSWALGFLQFIPGVGLLVAGIVMASMYPSVSKGGPIARENARGAANWGLTVLVGVVAGFLLAVILNAVSGNRGFFPTGIGVLVILAVAIAHLTTTIIGTVKASGGKTFSPPYAIPFIRR